MNLMFWKNRVSLTPEQKKIRNKQLILGAVSGMLLAFSFPIKLLVPFIEFSFPLISVPYLIFFALLPYFYVLEQKNTLAEISRFTYFTALIFSTITLYWVGSWTKEADPFLMISGFVLLFFNPLLFLIPSTLYYLAKKVFNKYAALLLFPFFWVTYEYVYSLTDLRFPWLTLGNSLSYFNTFIQIADIIGAYGLSLIILFVNAALYILAKSYIDNKKIKWVYAVVVAVLFLVPILYGNYKINNFEESSKKLKVGIIQPNLNPWNKWSIGSLQEITDIYYSLSDSAAAKGAKLLVWPETAYPVYLFSGKYENAVAKLRWYLYTNNVFLLTGMPDIQLFNSLLVIPPQGAKPTKYKGLYYTSFNAILFINPIDSKMQGYAKMKLVPFGERIPFVDQLPFLEKWLSWQVGISSWNVGMDTTVFLMKEDYNPDYKHYRDKLSGTHKIAGVVCIESIYPDFVAAFVRKGAEAIAVVTNDSWYGNSSGPYQHKEISILRAVENRRTVIRSANGGVSCIIDPLGRTVQETEMFTKTYLAGEIFLYEDLTFFTKYPLIFPLLASLVSIIILIMNIKLWILKKIKKQAV